MERSRVSKLEPAIPPGLWGCPAWDLGCSPGTCTSHISGRGDSFSDLLSLKLGVQRRPWLITLSALGIPSERSEWGVGGGQM